MDTVEQGERTEGERAREQLWAESVRRYRAKRGEEHLAAWYDYEMRLYRIHSGLRAPSPGGEVGSQRTPQGDEHMTDTREQGQTVEAEIRTLDQEIERLEAEEKRRLSRPRPIVAAKIKRLELQKRQTEAELEPLRAEREAAGKKLERLRKKRLEMEEEILEAQAAWSDPHTRIVKRERRLRDLDRQIAELKGEA